MFPHKVTWKIYFPACCAGLIARKIRILLNIYCRIIDEKKLHQGELAQQKNIFRLPTKDKSKRTYSFLKRIMLFVFGAQMPTSIRQICRFTNSLRRRRRHTHCSIKNLNLFAHTHTPNYTCLLVYFSIYCRPIDLNVAYLLLWLRS